jgi:hypothetical protein
MFVLRKNLTCRWPVTVTEPSPDDAGATIESEFTVDFLIIDREQREANDKAREALLEELQKETDPEALKVIRDKLTAFAMDRYCEAILGWSGIEADGKPFEFSSAALQQLLANDYVRRAIDAAYNEAVTLDKARLKN